MRDCCFEAETYYIWEKNWELLQRMWMYCVHFSKAKWLRYLMPFSEHLSFTHVTAVQTAVGASTMAGTQQCFNQDSIARTLYMGNGKMRGRWKDCQLSWKNIFLLIRLNTVPWFSARFYVDWKLFEAGIVLSWMLVRCPLLGTLSCRWSSFIIAGFSPAALSRGYRQFVLG